MNERRKLLHFSAWVAAGLLLYLTVACGTLGGAGEDLKKAARWLPDPYGAIAESAGTVLLLFAGNKGVKHVAKRRAAKKAHRDAVKANVSM